jgi:hypothetical protein
VSRSHPNSRKHPPGLDAASVGSIAPTKGSTPWRIEVPSFSPGSRGVEKRAGTRAESVLARSAEQSAFVVPVVATCGINFGVSLLWDSASSSCALQSGNIAQR